MEAPPTSPEYPIAKLRGPSFSLRKGGGGAHFEKRGAAPSPSPAEQVAPHPGERGVPHVCLPNPPLFACNNFPRIGTELAPESTRKQNSPQVSYSFSNLVAHTTFFASKV